MTDDVDQNAWLTLRLVPDVGRMRFHRLVEAFGSPEAALGANVEALRRVAGMDSVAAQNVARHTELVDLEHERDLIDKHGVRLVSLADDDYPVNLRNSFLPPPLLYVRGEFDQADRFAIAVVGSRISTSYGRSATNQIVTQLVAAGIVIVSGLAAGIDSAAHRAALENNGRTFAVLANGLARCYPAENRGLMEQIAEHGAVISEYPMEERPARMNFPERNRVLVSLALGTLVGEAPSRSGSLISADMTIEENRSLYAIPADINRKTARGSNALIRQGAARLVTSGADILDDLQGQLRGLLDEQGVQSEPEPVPNLTEEEHTLIDHISLGPVTMDELMAHFASRDITIGRLSTLLLGLEMKKQIRQLPGKVFTAAAHETNPPRPPN